MIRLMIFLLCVTGIIFLVMRSFQTKTNLPKLVLLDRDGVINVDRPNYVKSPEEFEFIPGVIEAIKRLNDAKIKVMIITNQGGIGRGLYTHDDLADIHAHMEEALKAGGARVDQIFICPDHPDSPSHRRKPGTGMFEEALRHINVKPEDTHMIGDDMRDLIPAFKCGIHRHLVLTGKGKKTLENPELKTIAPLQVHKDLLEAVKDILKA
jgi:D-glycero-D-manno-heptose 1,7-bisphosphate phosphatase